MAINYDLYNQSMVFGKPFNGTKDLFNMITGRPLVDVKKYEDPADALNKSEESGTQSTYLAAPYPINNKRQARQFTRATIKGAEAMKKKNDAQEASLNASMQYTYNPWSYKKRQKKALVKRDNYANALALRDSEAQRKQDLQNKQLNFSRYNINPNAYLKEAGTYYNGLNADQQKQFKEANSFFFDESGNMKTQYDNDLRNHIANQQQNGNSIIDYNLYKKNLANANNTNAAANNNTNATANNNSNGAANNNSNGAVTNLLGNYQHYADLFFGRPKYYNGPLYNKY